MGEALGKLLDNTCFDRVLLPDFMPKVNAMLDGGYEMGTFNIIAGDTSVGKSTLVNNIGYHIAMTTNYRPLVVSLEANDTKLARHDLEIHTQKKFPKKDKEAAIRFMEENSLAIQELSVLDGEDRMTIIDDRSRLTSIDDIFNILERGIVRNNSRVIVLDVYTDLVDSMSLEQQNEFVGRVKGLIARFPVCIIAVCHTRKLERRDKEGNRAIEPERQEVMGSKTLIGSCTTLILIWRDIYAEDEIEKNTTYSKVDKNRDEGETGESGAWFYSKTTRTLYDLKEYIENRLQ